MFKPIQEVVDEIAWIHALLRHEKDSFASRQFNTDVGSKFMQEIELMVVDELNVEAVVNEYNI